MYKQGRGTDLISLSLRFPIYQGCISDSSVRLTDTACAENLPYIRTNVRAYFPSFQQSKKVGQSLFFGQVFIMLLYKGFPHSPVGIICPSSFHQIILQFESTLIVSNFFWDNWGQLSHLISSFVYILSHLHSFSKSLSNLYLVSKSKPKSFHDPTITPSIV